MSLDPALVEILVCPQDNDQVLVNERLGIAYPIEDGIPVMLVDDAIAWPQA